MWRGPNVFYSLLFFARVDCTVCTLHLLHKFSVKGKSLYFTRRFEFPACAKLVGSTITFFSVFLLFCLKDDLSSLIEDPAV